MVTPEVVGYIEAVCLAELKDERESWKSTPGLVGGGGDPAVLDPENPAFAEHANIIAGSIGAADLTAGREPSIALRRSHGPSAAC
jgi:hypothetical protein